MARGGTTLASRLGGTTTYKAKKRSSAAQTTASNYKSSAIKTLPTVTQRKAGLKAAEDAVETSDEEDDGGEGTDVSEAADDLGHEEDEFDPHLKAMVVQSATSNPRHNSSNKKRKAIGKEANSEDDDEEKLSSSSSSTNDDDESDGSDDVVLASQRLSKKIKTTAALISGRGKENAPIIGEGGVTKTNDQKIQPRPDHSTVTRNKNKNKDHVVPASHLTKSRARHTEHTRSEAASYHQQAAKLLHDQMSDTEQTDSTGDRNPFGFQTTLIRTLPTKVVAAKADHREERYNAEGFEEGEGEQDDSGEEVVEQVRKEYGQAREEIKQDVKEIKAAFRGIGASMKAQQCKVSKQLMEEIQPMQQSTVKIYKTMAGQYTEKMLDQQSLLQKSLGEYRHIFAGAKKGLAEKEETLRKKMLDLQEDAANLQERKKKVLERALKQIIDLNKRQAKEERAILAEMERLRDKAKAKVFPDSIPKSTRDLLRKLIILCATVQAEKLLDPAVLNAKFAKQTEHELTYSTFTIASAGNPS
ncbi:hypothetical protein QFC21_001474 [Naganishia friedmannii]|uniref:Uncharacterized protein n=1 Tax=Naganishia friedmannii TaxID=89922 RepID=A0ACC2W3Q0_9TREE|nr:hypothetical protein QFC21_001474 [Naganishia friedmannii]